MMESDFLFCVYLTFLGLLFMGSALFLLKSMESPVKAIPAADVEDSDALGCFCDPDVLWEILPELRSEKLDLLQIDRVIKALHKRGYVVIGPSREEITQAAAMYQDRSVLS